MYDDCGDLRHRYQIQWLHRSQTLLSDTTEIQTTRLPKDWEVLLGLDILSHWQSCAMFLYVQSVSALQETTTCFLFCHFSFLVQFFLTYQYPLNPFHFPFKKFYSAGFPYILPVPVMVLAQAQSTWEFLILNSEFYKESVLGMPIN